MLSSSRVSALLKLPASVTPSSVSLDSVSVPAVTVRVAAAIDRRWRCSVARGADQQRAGVVNGAAVDGGAALSVTVLSNRQRVGIAEVAGRASRRRACPWTASACRP